MKIRQLTDKKKDFLIKMREVYYVYELADILNCSKQQIYRFFRTRRLKYKHKNDRGVDELTNRELNALKLFAYPLDVIAKKMMVEPSTVRTYTRNIFNKFYLPTNNRGAAIIYALKNGILQIEDFELSD